MSRHEAIERLCACAPPVPIAVDWSRFVAPSSGEDAKSPIDAFYESHRGLNKLAALVDGGHVDSDVRDLLGGQILLGYVSATELYLRQAIAQGVKVCPLVRERNRAQTIPFGALDYYEQDLLGTALTERVSFSEPGTVKTQLEQRLGVAVKSKSSLGQSIVDYELLCQLRHALIHSHGAINSTNAAHLSASEIRRSARARIDTQCLQWVASITANLVRDVNSEVFRSIIWSWACKGILTGDARKDKPRLRRLSTALGSNIDQDGDRGVTPEDDLNAIVRTILADIAI